MACPIFTGCTFSCSTEPTDYNLVIYPSSKAFSWRAVRNAVSYEIYCNDTLVDTADTTECIYEFGKHLTTLGDYNFRVKAVTQGLSFTTKGVEQTATYNNTEVLDLDVKNSPTIVEGEYKDATTLTINNSIVTFDKVDNVDGYMLGIYSNGLGYKEYNLDDKISYVNNKYNFHLSSAVFGLRNEIVALRLLVKVGSDKFVASPVKYYNPDNYAGYTDNIYIFDGKIYDHYINTLDELQNIIYHSFIYRDEDFNIKISSEIYDMATIFDGGDFEECLDLLIFQYGFGAFSETSAYMAGNLVGQDRYFASAISTKDRTYNIKVTYMGIYECDLEMTNTTADNYSQEYSLPYYESFDFESLREGYASDEEYLSGQKFASDSKYLSTSVETTEELYWAVENGVTPTFDSTESRAYRIYNEAKLVIGDIISPTMTDFEKTLSIFDWICVNTVYDYATFSNTDDIPTKFPCYYLEGVFDKGVAVCDGFSKAFSLMCNMLDIECIRIVGIASDGGEEGGHAWNKVLLDKDTTDTTPAKYYIVDITWTEIFSSSTNEILSHRFFLIDDDMIDGTHADFEGREEFMYLPAGEMYGYYNERKFTYDSEEHDYLIDSDEEFETLFNYMYDSSQKSMEVMVDLDYLIARYETNTGTEYNPLEDIALSGSGYVYYGKLKDNMLPFLKEKKNEICEELYIFISYSLNAVKYNEAGDKGIIHNFTFNFLIDEDSEVQKLVNTLSSGTLRGTYDLYVNHDVLDVHAHINYMTRIKELFDSLVASTNINITFDLVKAEYVYDKKDNENIVAAIYTMTVTDK